MIDHRNKLTIPKLTLVGVVALLSGCSGLFGGIPAKFEHQCMAITFGKAADAIIVDVPLSDLAASLKSKFPAEPKWTDLGGATHSLKIGWKDAFTEASHLLTIELIEMEGAAKASCGPGALVATRMQLDGEVSNGPETASTVGGLLNEIAERRKAAAGPALPERPEAETSTPAASDATATPPTTGQPDGAYSASTDATAAPPPSDATAVANPASRPAADPAFQIVLTSPRNQGTLMLTPLGNDRWKFRLIAIETFDNGNWHDGETSGTFVLKNGLGESTDEDGCHIRLGRLTDKSWRVDQQDGMSCHVDLEGEYNP